MKQNWLILLLICIILTGCTSQPQEDKRQTSTQYSENTGTAIETESSFEGYKKIVVDGGDMSGYREANVVVDIGFGDREYWAFTNEYGQLIRVTAKEIILQDDATEPVTSGGRYYNDEADVPGTERADMDKGHIIADSLGGVSNAYNVTPQDSTLNRHGDQAYMEKVIAPMADMMEEKENYHTR
ncbi:MAG TPA: DNA/RNA non-specific endonuclease [Anaerovoracaceae bacterium]|nr:DNA/RNA non-specific endonuclease [Anaerovoracaceae bacterium]